jgi:hypothetical protein
MSSSLRPRASNQAEQDWRLLGRILVLGSSGLLLIIAILVVRLTLITVADIANWSQLIGALLALIALYFAWEHLLSTAIGGAELDAVATPKAVRRSASWRACATRSWA